jgi:hypothetical protein
MEIRIAAPGSRQRDRPQQMTERDYSVRCVNAFAMALLHDQNPKRPSPALTNGF